MSKRNRSRIVSSICGAGVCALVWSLPFGTALAQNKTFEMKISTPTINDTPDTFARNFLAAVEKDSGGRIKGQVYPASQLGSIPRQIEGTQFGAIQCEVVPPEFMVGLDPRFELMAAPGLVDSIAQGQKVAQDPTVRKLMLSLGADKGLRGIGLFMSEPSDVVTKAPIRTLADFKGKKIRIFASQFQSVAFGRLGVTPVAMSLGDVLPAIQQGAIDGAVTGMGPISHMHFIDAAKYVTMTNQPSIFIIAEVNKKWYESLPEDLQHIIDKDGAEQSVAIVPTAASFRAKAEQSYAASGGEEIKLAPDEQATLLKTLSSVGADVSKANPQLAEGYRIVTAAAARAAAAPSQ
ncbi:MAG TPA: TRAP transporter substrate-binding protein [Xanthobacteraceae bacterium]|nr:TRAP transporter substrate-binding protein [Xanthobacteraceae bacterium]